MLQLKTRLPTLNETPGRPEWPNLPVDEKPLIHGNHDEATLYANEGDRFAWVANDSYHLKPKGDGATIMKKVVFQFPVMVGWGWKLSNQRPMVHGNMPI